MTITRLKLALQKKGRLNDNCMALLLQCGLKFHRKENALLCHCENLALDLIFVRDDDIPTLVSSGVCDMGIIGENVLREQVSLPGINLSKKLGFSTCRLSIAVPKEMNYQGVFSLNKRRIATSYPQLLQQYLNEKNVQAEIVSIAGSVEIAPRLNMADAIFDLVSTGGTLEENHLKEVEIVLRSEAVLIQTAAPLSSEKQETYDLLLRRINGVLQAQDSKYIMFHAPREALPRIAECLPGFETPTILPLEGLSTKVAVHVVSREGVFWDTLEKLKALGASSILVLPIEKMLN